MGTYGVHNVKFYNPEPKTINCIACEPKSSKLAVARADQSIEIWDISETPHVDRVFIGDPLSNSIECLAWFNDRLFSGGLQGFINEYDLRRLRIESSTAVTSGTCWCLAVHKKKRLLAAGTEQGHINLFQISDKGLLYEKLLDKQQGRILCLAWHPSGDYLATGCAAAVRVWSVHSGHAVHKMSLDSVGAPRGPGPRGRRPQASVWALAFLADFSLITGDSGGFVRFWDGKTGVQFSEVKTHKKDILALCVSDDENYLYCAGVDPTVVCFQRVRKSLSKAGPGPSGNDSSGPTQSSWVRSVNRVIHEGDVKSLALDGNRLYSGGLDSYLSLSYYPPKTLVKYPCTLAQTSPVCVAKDTNHILLQYSSHLELWSLGTPKEIADPDTPNSSGLQLSSGVPLATVPRLVLKVRSLNNATLRCSAISNDGVLLAYSSEESVRLLAVDMEGDTPQMSRIKDIPQQLNECVITHMLFSSDSSIWVTVSLNGPIYVVDISTLELRYSIDTYKSNLMSDIISLVQMSDCNQYIACADRKSHVVIFKDGQHWTSLPRYKKATTALGISPGASPTLVTVYSDHRILEFDLDRKSFTPFSRKLESNHPKEWLSRQLPVRGIEFDARNPTVLYLMDDSTLCVLNKNKNLAHADAKIPRLGPRSVAPGDNSNSTHVVESKAAFHFVRRNKHLVYFGTLNDKEMVSVQVNPLSFMEQLPPTWSKKQFGVS